jgi:hypothetical protein
MDRFLQEVNDEAHLGAHTAGGKTLLDRPPHPLSEREPEGVDFVHQLCERIQSA